MKAYTPQQITRLVNAARDASNDLNEVLNADLAVGNDDEEIQGRTEILDELDASLEPFEDSIASVVAQ